MLRGYALRSMDTPNPLSSLSRTNLFKLSFMKRIVREWNSLPLDIREASSVEDFKLKSLKFCKYIFDFFLCVCVYLLVGL